MNRLSCSRTRHCWLAAIGPIFVKHLMHRCCPNIGITFKKTVPICDCNAHGLPQLLNYNAVRTRHLRVWNLRSTAVKDVRNKCGY